MSFVLDSSVAISWCFKDEATERSISILERTIDLGCWVPSIWHLETSNVLLQAHRRGRGTLIDVENALGLLAGLPVETDVETEMRAYNEILFIARDEGLTTYDASYVELAMRMELPLASNDKAVLRVANKIGIPTL
jgi:predicted nucleic acid-binding protein